MPPKTSTQRGKDRVDRLKSEGFKLVRNLYIREEKEAELREIVKRLNGEPE